MPRAKLYPRNKTLPIAVAEIELEALRLEAKRRDISVSDLGHEKLRAGGLMRTVAAFFAEDVPELEQQYPDIGTTGGG